MNLILLISIFIALELFESNWQKADHFYGVIKNNYQIYKKSIFIYFLLNPTFFYSLYLSILLNNFNFFMSSIVVMKFLDISFRLFLLSKIQNNQSIQKYVPINFDMNIIFRYINVIIYPLMFIFALV
jgi:hypothetical protein